MKFDAKKTIAALAMSATLFAMPVSALAVTVDGATAPGNNTLVTKNWSVPESRQEDLAFTLKYVKGEAYTSAAAGVSVVNDGTLTPVAEGGTVNGAIALQKGTTTLSTATVFNNVDFSAPGLYKFTLQENKGDSELFVYDGTVWDIEVRVLNKTNNDGSIVMNGDSPELTVDYVWAYDAAGDKVTTGATFNNTTNNVGELTVTKQVKGNMADTSKAFDIIIAFSGLEDGVNYSFTTTSDTFTGDKTFTSTNGNATVTVPLAATQNVVFENLPVGATYTITEGSQQLTDNEENANVGDGYTALMSGADGSVDTTADSVTVQNTKSAETITGLTVTFLPYIGGLAVAGAGAGALVISRRRNHDADNF